MVNTMVIALKEIFMISTKALIIWIMMVMDILTMKKSKAFTFTNLVSVRLKLANGLMRTWRIMIMMVMVLLLLMKLLKLGVMIIGRKTIGKKKTLEITLILPNLKLDVVITQIPTGKKKTLATTLIIIGRKKTIGKKTLEIILIIIGRKKTMVNTMATALKEISTIFMKGLSTLTVMVMDILVLTI